MINHISVNPVEINDEHQRREFMSYMQMRQGLQELKQETDIEQLVLPEGPDPDATRDGDTH